MYRNSKMDLSGFLDSIHAYQVLHVYLLLLVSIDSFPHYPFSYVHTESCGDRSSMFRSFWGISVYDCLVECGLRPRCLAVNHRQPYDNLCELLDSTDVVSDNAGCLYIRRENIDFNSQHIKDCSCNSGEMCDKLTGACSKQECDPVRTIDNGIVIGNRFTIGSSYRISCDGLSKPENNVTTATCMPNGQWDAVPSCLFEECTPFTIANGSLIGSDYSIGAALTVSCSPGYEEVNRIYTVNCLSTRDWDYLPSCLLQACPQDWSQLADSCFYLSTASDGQFSQSESQTECEAKQGYLAELSTQEINEFIRTKLYQLNYSGGYLYWIGLQKKRGKWKWTTSDIEATYTDWELGQPQEDKGENCVCFMNDNRQWHDADCSETGRYICEMPAST